MNELANFLYICTLSVRTTLSELKRRVMPSHLSAPELDEIWYTVRVCIQVVGQFHFFFGHVPCNPCFTLTHMLLHAFMALST